MTLKGAPITTIDLENYGSHSLGTYGLSHFSVSNAKNMVTTRLVARPNPSVCNKTHNTGVLKAHKEGKRDTAAKCPNYAKRPALSGRRWSSGDRRLLKNDQTLLLFPKAPISGDRTSEKELPAS